MFAKRASCYTKNCEAALAGAEACMYDADDLLKNGDCIAKSITEKFIEDSQCTNSCCACELSRRRGS